MRAGDILVTVNGEYVVVEQIAHELLEEPEVTYNFEVEDFHTYYVGNTSVLVHNVCSPKQLISQGKEFFGSNGKSLGKCCKNPGMKIDWTKCMDHGAQRMAERGMTKKLMEKIVKNGYVLQQTATKYLFFTTEGVVVLDAGRVVTTYGTDYFDEVMKGIIQVFFGG